MAIIIHFKDILTTGEYKLFLRKITIVLNLIERMEGEIAPFRSLETEPERRYVIGTVKSIIEQIIPNLESSVEQLDKISMLINNIEYKKNTDTIMEINDLEVRIGEGETIILDYRRVHGGLPGSEIPLEVKLVLLLFTGLYKINLATEEWIINTKTTITAIAKLPQPRIISRAATYLKQGAPLLKKALEAIIAVAPIFAAII